MDASEEKAEASERAIINILEDFTSEKNALEKTQRALLNILDDYSAEKSLAEDAQKGVVNILEDLTQEKKTLENTERAVLNILDDYSLEKTLAENPQKSVINILEDLTNEKATLENVQRATLNILEDYSIEKIFAENTQKAVINILEDLSSEKASVEKMNIELTSLNKEAEQFVYIASHDLQEPLRTVSNFISLLQKKHSAKLDKNGIFYLDTIINAAGRMQALIKDLLDYSRVGRDRKKVVIDCNLLLEEVLNDLYQSIQESKAEIHYGLLPLITGYHSGLKSLFQNLISNAIKFRKKGTRPVIKISSKKEAKEYIFSIKDNGIGIDEAFYDKLFIIFQRLHHNEEYPGTGIGLAQSKKIVEMHGGRIWVESVAGKGSIFCFSIPLA